MPAPDFPARVFYWRKNANQETDLKIGHDEGMPG
jgi:hypothetical protein